MITLDELISDLQRLRQQAGQDSPVRLVMRNGNDGEQLTVAWIELADLSTKTEKQFMVLLYAGDTGDVVATMDWPMSPEEYDRRAREE